MGVKGIALLGFVLVASARTPSDAQTLRWHAQAVPAAGSQALAVERPSRPAFVRSPGLRDARFGTSRSAPAARFGAARSGSPAWGRRVGAALRGAGVRGAASTRALGARSVAVFTHGRHGRASASPTGASTARGSHGAPAHVAGRHRVHDGRLRNLARGTLRDGPRETFQAIREHPRFFIGALAAVGAIGAAGSILGLAVEPFMLALSASALGYDIKRNMPAIRAAHGVARWRAVGSGVLWPTLMLGGGFAVSSLLVPGGEAAEVAQGATPAGVLGSAAESVVLGGDEPLLFVSGAGHSQPAATATAR